MKILLIDLSTDLCEAWSRELLGVDDVTIHNDTFYNYAATAVVSPANSFAIMNGGVDLPLRELCHQDIESDIRDVVREGGYGRFLPVGGAVSVQSGIENYPYLISAPTMETPKNVSDTLNAYASTMAALAEAHNQEFHSIAMFGMGAATGGYHPETCAKQMAMAIKDFIDPDRCPEYKTFDEAHDFISETTHHPLPICALSEPQRLK